MNIHHKGTDTALLMMRLKLWMLQVNPFYLDLYPTAKMFPSNLYPEK